MSSFTFPLLTPSEVSVVSNDPVDPIALEQSRSIVNKIKDSIDRSKTLLEIGQSFSDLPKNSTTYIISKAEQKSAYDSLPPAQKSSLDSIHARVKTFASAQRAAITNIEIPIPGGFAGHKVTACKTAGCYAPGGRYPLPSSVVMTCATARAAGCDVVVLSTPNPQLITKAAGYVAGCDVFVAVGGAQAIAAMAYGVKGNGGEMEDIPPCDVICGPGNKWVTAAKSLVNGHCGIDMLAGPSEVLVICDDTADVKVVASDLIAQAEHDVVARPILVSDNEDVVNGIIAECKVQLSTLPSPNRETATTAFGTGFAVICGDIEECVRVSDSIAPEHLEIQTLDHQAVADSCRCYGGLFIGTRAAEVLGDYGAGPNHTLPTGGTGRYTGGLSVFSFLGIRTWMRVDDASASKGMVEDSVVMARCEGLEGHARAAEKRL